jgi:hypothetical protein
MFNQGRAIPKVTKNNNIDQNSPMALLAGTWFQF